MKTGKNKLNIKVNILKGKFMEKENNQVDDELKNININLKFNINPLDEWKAIERYYTWLSEKNYTAESALVLIEYKKYLEGKDGRI